MSGGMSSSVIGGNTAGGEGGGGTTSGGGGTSAGGGGTLAGGEGESSAAQCEREARSVALEKAYVHEVYEQISAEHPDAQRGRTWPKVNQFLDDLEPGSLVCDVGCGSGKYLNVNPMVFNLGGDRCTKLVETAKEKNNEVLVCDNLALPFRDESFDAVLSIAVVHHFATTERRVNALRELTRVLRIGGRLVISVWAMEQRHRKFESQDVLVPWHRPQRQQAPSLEVTSTTTTTSGEEEEEDCPPGAPPPYHAYTQTEDSDSCRSVRPAGNGQRRRARSRHKGRSIDPAKAMTSSPSSSSLSSPNETCYSFVRKALQKLAGGKRGGSRHRPWFLESWTSCASSKCDCPPARRYEPDGCEDILDLPIELRRLEGDQDGGPGNQDGGCSAPHRRQTFACSHHSSELQLNHKSKSLSDIINVEQKGIVRSRSSVPSLEVRPSEEEAEPTEPGTKTESTTTTSTSLKPKLVKQKKSVCEEDFEGEEGDEPTDMKDLIKALPDFRTTGHQGSSRKGNVFKQSSMNEELMSTERLKEKEKVRQNIQKQASLNEDLMFRRNRTLDSLRDTLFSASTAKRFQILKNGFTNKIKSSTTGIEKVLGNSSKHGIVRILQNWTSGDASTVPQPTPTPEPPTPPADSKQLIVVEKKEGERRHSREDGSDSSKDSSLQSDTSVDSEDSFASVIFVPKPEPTVEQSATSTNTSPTLQSTPASPQPTSPKFKIPPPVSPKLKNAPQISFGMSSYPSSPKLKHPGQLLSGSPTPTSPKGRFYSQPTSPRPYQTTFLTSPTAKAALKLQQSPNGSNPSKVFLLSNAPKTRPTVGSYTLPNISHLTPTSPTGDRPADPGSPTDPLSRPTPIPVLRTPSPKARAKSLTSPKEVTKAGSFLDLRPTLSPGLSPTTSPCKDAAKKGSDKEDAPSEKKPSEKNQDELKQLQDMFKHKSKPQYPIVRRSATVGSGTGGSKQSSSEARASMTKLMSVELFNPETDDMDSDSSGVSSPDSVGSVISVLNDEEHAATVTATAATITSNATVTTAATVQDVDQKEHKKEVKPLRDQHPVKQENQSQPPVVKEPVVSKDTQPTPTTKPTPVPDSSNSTAERPSEPTPVGVEIVMSLPVPSQTGVIRVEVEKVESERTVSKAIKSPRISPSHSLLEAVADVASSLEETVDAVIQSSPRARRKQLKLFESPDPLTILQDDLVTRRSPHRIEEAKLSPARVTERMNTWNNNASTSQTKVEEPDIEKKRWSLQADESERFLQTNNEASRAVSLGAIPKKFNRSKTHIFDEDGKSERKEAKRLEKEKREELWDEECRQHLTDFAEKLSEKLLVEIDKYREQGGMCQTQSISLSPEFEFVTNITLQKNIEIMNDPYLNKLSEELQGLTKLSLELQEKNKTFLNQIRGIELSNEASGKDRPSSFKQPFTEDIDVKMKDDNEKLICDKLVTNTRLDSCASTSKQLPGVVTNTRLDPIDSCAGTSKQFPGVVANTRLDPIDSCANTSKQLPGIVTNTRLDPIDTCAGTSKQLPGVVIVPDVTRSSEQTVVEIVRTPLIKTSTVEVVASKLLKDGEKQLKALDKPMTTITTSRFSGENVEKASDVKLLLSTKTTLKKPELCIDTSDIDSEMESTEDSWADSRRNTMLPVESSGFESGEKKDDDLMRIEILPGSEVPRRPSISVETTDPAERALKDKVDMSIHDSIGPLRSGISLESSDAGDFSERTGSSSDGSRAGSRRDTIQICDSGSVLSLRPGLSLESSDAGDISERTASGSESSRAGDSRRNTISIGSGSQASLLRPGTSLESSDAGDVSDRTGSGSDYSRGKTASTASLTSDRAGSDCSKDARYADRRVARCDGRSSSEDTASHRSCMNKLVRQRASTQEPPETLTKTESCETSLSGSTSQESLMSDSGGGAITFHRYYHVFKEGELDQLIERYVENLHIISSYYDHANWCVIAEKVHVWTI